MDPTAVSPATSIQQTPPRPPQAERPDLRAAAQQLEAAFLSEMLGAAGFGAARDAFGGGAGEEQFASILRRAQADGIVQAGGLGLAKSIYAALLERSDE